MKVIILAGGLGTRLGQFTELVPKPMIKVGGKPIIWHIMQTYAKFGHKDFFLALGYKSEVIQEYFLNYKTLNSDFVINLATGIINLYDGKIDDWQVNLINTGVNSMTGGRTKRMQRYIGN